VKETDFEPFDDSGVQVLVTRPSSPTVWQGLLEQIEASQPLPLAACGNRLRDRDAHAFARHCRWPVWLMHAAFQHALRQRLVAVHKIGGGPTATVDHGNLVDLLRQERRRQLDNPSDDRAAPALAVFRARKLLTNNPWLDQVIEDVLGETDPGSSPVRKMTPSQALRATSQQPKGGAREHA